MTPPTLPEQVITQVLTAVNQQITDLRPDGAFIADLASTMAEFVRFRDRVKTFPQDATVTSLLADVELPLNGVLKGTSPRPALGEALVALRLLAGQLPAKIDGWIAASKATATDKPELLAIVQSLIDGTTKLLARRPDVTAVLDDLAAMKELRGGPADAVAFHDFHVLQMAFKDVWLHAFDATLQRAAEDLYTLLVTDKVELGSAAPANLPNCNDVAELKELIDGLQTAGSPPIPPDVWTAFGTLAAEGWPRLGPEQQSAVMNCAKIYNGFHLLPFGGDPGAPPPWQQAKDTGEALLKSAIANPQSAAGRLTDLVQSIQKMLSEPYAFDVFAKDSYNFGLMLTYRQRWEPGPYQAGDLVATIPLAPGEVRKFTKKRTVKTSRAVKEIEKSMSSRSTQSSESTRAEYEIMQRATTATNFKMTASGSFNIGIGSIGATSEFGGNQDQVSASTKKGLHEATLKAAEEYRLERTLEVDTTTSTETEETTSGEISNPNNEITVTYLFYELQRRFRVQEYLYRARPVILVAQEVPAPDAINEAWLIKQQWIISRVLLDDSLRPALTYLSSGFAGDELAVEVKRTHWDTQRRLALSLEAAARDQMDMRDKLREALVTTTLTKDLVPHMPGALKFFTFGVDPSEGATDALEANRRAIETRVGYAEAALADAQEKAKNAATSLDAATREYASALEAQYNRRVSVDQLRVHVKQNILYYMQAIWDHEPPDQRFFRLYKVEVACLDADPTCTVAVTGEVSLPSKFSPATFSASPTVTAKVMDVRNIIEVDKICSPGGGIGAILHDLVEIADLDNPLGYKGNYMIFPLKHACHIADYMLAGFIDNYLGLIDPDGSDSFTPEEFEARWAAANATERDKLKLELTDYLTKARRSTDEIIVPTGQLFIEALPGTHPLLEDFKLAHRVQDVRKVMAEVRHAELENLRLAARLAAMDKKLLEDPDIERKVTIDGSGIVLGVGGGGP